MKTIEELLLIHGTVRRLEKQAQVESDPRVLRDIAETLDTLAPSFDKLVERLARELQREQQARKGEGERHGKKRSA